ncbi:MAG: hypothetical protein ABI629_10445 [bacterium]
MSNNVISSARALIFVVPGDGSDPIFLQIVEDLRMEKVYQGEILSGLGQGVGVDSSLNNEQGTVQWGRVPRMEQRVLDAIAPHINEWTQFERFNLLAVDAVTRKGLATAVGVIPGSLGLGFQNGRATRENYRGECLYIQVGEETAQAA